MNKSILAALFSVLLLLTGYFPTVLAHNPATNKDVLVTETISEPQSLDPAWAYDTASGDVIQNVYETLITYKRVYTDGPYAEGKITEFEPALATSVPTMQAISQVSPEGLQWNGRLVFNIRSGVTFHDGNTMTPTDVEYSFERELVQDRDGGPQWMLYFPLLGVYGGDTSDPLFGAKIDHAIESNSTHVWFNFNIVMPQVTVNQIFSQTWGSVLEKSWAIAHGDFSGNFADWANYHNPAVSPLDNPPAMMGTGPYKFTFWIPANSWQIDRFADYWDGWPARVQSGSSQRLPGYVSTVLEKYNPVWINRRPNFLSGASDWTTVDRQFRDQLFGQPDIVCYYPFTVLSNTAAFFTFNITDTSNWIGNTKGAAHTLGGDPAFVWSPNGIPVDLFNDPNVRKGFNFAFDYDGWLTASFLGEGVQPSSPIVSNLPYYNPAEEKYNYNLTEAKYYLKLAWGGVDNNVPGVHDPDQVIPGKLWTGGMGFTITYNIGNVGRQTAAQTWANQLNFMNGVFNVATAGVAWWVFLPDMVASKLPIFVIGWLADYADPDNFVFPYMHSQGTFAAWQKYDNPRVDDLVVAGSTTADDPVGAYEAASSPWNVANPLALKNADGSYVFNTNALPPNGTFPRRSIYYEIQRIYYDDAPGVVLSEAWGRHWSRGWVRGWYNNPLYQGFPYYHLFKQGTHLGDANMDGHVDVADLGWISGRWGVQGWSPPGSTANVEGDINGGIGGTVGSNKGPAPGVPDGTVDISDLALVSAYWDTSPTGPSHP